METMKFYTEEEILDKHIGKKGTPKRDQFEADLNSFLIGEAIKQARQSKMIYAIYAHNMMWHFH